MTATTPVTIAAGTPVRRRRVWPVPVLLLALTFVVPSLLAWRPVLGAETTALIRQVLLAPNAEKIPALLPIAKLVLLGVWVVGVLGIRRFPQIVLGYYAAILVVIALFQNTATLPGGFALLLGNVTVQLIVAALCIRGLGSTDDTAPLLRGRLWLLAPMLLAWAYPYATVGQDAVMGGWERILLNGAGVTYCMVTPVIAGVMLLRPAAYGARTRLAVGALGTIFGLLNMMTWFVVYPASWWMGVLHLPLLTISLFCLVTSWRDARTTKLPAQD